MTRILLVQLADIGDLILTTPAITSLRRHLPDAHLTLLTTRHSVTVLEKDAVDAVITLDRRQINGSMAFFRPATLRQIARLRQTPFDTVIFFHHLTLALGTLKFAYIAWAARAPQVIGLQNGKGWFLTDSVPDQGFGALHQAQYWLALVGLLGVEAPAERAHVAFDGGVLPLPASSQKRFIIHTGSGGYSVARRWSAAAFAATADALHRAHDAQIVFVGTPEDGADQAIRLMEHRPVNLTGKTSLTQLADVIRSADLYIGADSGIMHLASAVRTPTVAIFGSSNPRAWGPWSPNGLTAIVQSAPLCSPCSYVGDRIGAREGCAARTCMRMVTPEQVVATANALLADRPVTRRDPIYPQSTDAVTTFLGLPHQRLTHSEAVARLRACALLSAFHLVILSDYARCLAAANHPILRTLYERVALVLPCGTGMLWASSWKRQDLPERLHPARIIADVLAFAQADAHIVALVGQYAPSAEAILKIMMPRLSVVSIAVPDDELTQEDALVAQINASGAMILLCGWDVGSSDLWLARNAPRLRARLAISIGDILRDIGGMTPTTPETLEELHLGWAYATLREPSRLRAWLGIVRFIARIVTRG